MVEAFAYEGTLGLCGMFPQQQQQPGHKARVSTPPTAKGLERKGSPVQRSHCLPSNSSYNYHQAKELRAASLRGYMVTPSGRELP